MQFKLNKIVAVLAVAIGVTACNSGSNSTPSNNIDQTKLPVSIERNNNRSFTICGKYHHADSLVDLAKESGGWGCVAGNKQIRLNPLFYFSTNKKLTVQLIWDQCRVSARID